MSYWFSKSDDELGDEQKWDNGVALVIPLDANRDEALERGHLLESEWFQQSAVEVDRYSEAWEMVGEEVGVSGVSPLLRSYCNIDSRERPDPPVVMLLPIRLWEKAPDLFRHVNCGTCRGRYLCAFRSNGPLSEQVLEKAESLQALWSEIYSEINPKCGKHHHAQVATNNLLICVECGRWGYELERLGHSVSLP